MQLWIVKPAGFTGNGDARGFVALLGDEHEAGGGDFVELESTS
jgi:hypothetical protein